MYNQHNNQTMRQDKLEYISNNEKIFIHQDKDSKLFENNLKDKIFNHINELINDQNAVTKIDNLAPFIYHSVFPDFELKPIHWEYLILPYRKQLSRKFGIGIEEIPVGINEMLSCQVSTTYIKNKNYIVVEFIDIEFLKTHQIKLSNPFPHTSDYLVQSFIQSKLFDNQNKKLKGYLNIIKCLYQENDEKNLRISIYDTADALLSNSVDFEEFIDYLKSLGLEKKDDRPFFNFPDYSHFLTEEEIKLKNSNFPRQYCKIAFDLKQSKLAILNEIIELGGHGVIYYLYCDSVNELDKNIETISKIENWKNKLKNIELLTKDEDLDNHNLLSYLEHSDIKDNTFYNLLFEYCKFWIRQKSKYKYNKIDLNFVIGKFENLHCRILNDTRIDIKNKFIYLEELLDFEIQTKKRNELISYVEPISLEYNKIYGYEIKELYNQRLLDDEGNYQKHCVAGYRPNNNVRLFSIRWGEKRHTTMIAKTKESASFKVSQSCGFKNKHKNNYDEKTKQAINDIETFLVNSLNKQKIDKSEEDIFMDQVFE